MKKLARSQLLFQIKIVMIKRGENMQKEEIKHDFEIGNWRYL